MKKFFQGVMRCLKSSLAWVRNGWRSCVEVLSRWCSGQDLEPVIPKFDQCNSREQIQAKVKAYVAKCTRWQARERARFLKRNGRHGALNSGARWFWVLLAALATLSIAITAFWVWGAPYLCCTEHFSLADLLDFFKGSTGAILLASPVAYVIWWFRDANAVAQIENHRKDVNLKEFQKLSEWVTGPHPTVSATETTVSKPEEDAGGNGERALVISAIYQVQPFLRGDHGESFRYPSLRLLLSIWPEYRAAFMEDINKKYRHRPVSAGSPELRDTFHSTSLIALGAAVNEVLMSGGGAELSWQNHWLRGSELIGLGSRGRSMDLADGNFSGLQLTDCYFRGGFAPGCNFEFTQFGGVDLILSNFIGANLSYSAFKGITRVSDSKFIGADLHNAVLTQLDVQRSAGKSHRLRCDFRGADMSFIAADGGNFAGSQLAYADLSSAQLLRASLEGADLTGANLSQANLMWADLRGADLTAVVNLEGARLHNAFFDGKTKPASSEMRQRLMGLGAKDFDAMSPDEKSSALNPQVIDF